MIEDDPTVKVDMPKIHEKNIIRLDVDEVAKLLDEVESGENLTARQQQYHEKTKIRDLAMMTLLLGTGIRVSECVGLDIEDLDFRDNRIRIIRKGGKEEFVYFGAEVREALMNYIEDSRSKIIPKEGHEHALFYSIQRRRKYQCALPITSKQAHKCQIRRKYGKKIFQACNNLKTYYTA